MATSPGLRKGSDLWLKVALASLSPLLLLGLLEGVARLWEQRQANGLYAWELVASRRMVWDQYPEPGAGYTLMRPERHYEWQGIAVDINSAGLREAEIPYAKPPGTYRVLNLGDSVVMGWGVREEDTYGRRLEALLNEQSPNGQRYQVINAGVPGWSLDNALAYLQAEGLKYQPDLVLLDLTIANDVNGQSALLAGDDPPLFRWLTEKTYLWPFMQSQLAWAKARALGQARVPTIDPPTNPAKYFPQDPLSERWAERWATVTAIEQLAREHAAGFMLVLFPIEFQVLDPSFPTLAQEIFLSKAADAGIPAVDLLPTFQQACQAKPGGPCQREDRYLFADVWMHPSAVGHALAANAIQAHWPSAN